jgi:hypothetical protein
MWWTKRNKLNHGEHRLTTNEFQKQTRHQVGGCKEFFGKASEPKPSHIQKWQPPPDNFVMLNVDASFVEETGIGGWGCIARDSDGDILFAAAGSCEHFVDPMHDETISLLKAIDLAEQFGVGQVIFQWTVWACNKRSSPLRKIGHQGESISEKQNIY